MKTIRRLLRIQNPSLTRVLLTVLVIFMALSIIGIIIFLQAETRVIEPTPENKLKISWIERGGQCPLSYQERLLQYAHYARFSANAYKDSIAPNDSVSKIPSEWSRILYEVPNDKSKRSRIDWSKVYPKGRLEAPEFAFKVWQRMAQNQVDIVIAFRGTNDRKDWTSNSRWIVRKLTGNEDQYDLVKKLMPQVMKLIHEEYAGKKLHIVTTGHSLGGGLAQHAAYSTAEIEEVYAFDASPVTGYYDYDSSARTANSKAKKIDRIYERGEVLSYLRALLRPFYALTTKDPNITEIGFNFVKAKGIGAWFLKQHSMEELAKNLQEAAQ